MKDNVLIQDRTESAGSTRAGIHKGLYLLPSAFTAANLGMGFFAMMGALRGFQLVGGGTESELARAAMHFDNAAKAIGWAYLFDGIDGRLARMTKTTTEIGVQLDSLADVLTFGIAPAVLVYAWGYGSAFAEGSDLHKIGWLISLVYLMCGAFRLARFNVQASRPRVLASGTIKTDKKSFVGLPIPAAAGLIASIIHFSPRPLVVYSYGQGAIYSSLIIALVGILSVLMISVLRYTSFKSIGATKRSTRLAILAVLVIGALIWLYSQWVLLLLAGGYVLHGIVSKLYSMLFPHRSRE